MNKFFVPLPFNTSVPYRYRCGRDSPAFGDDHDEAIGFFAFAAGGDRGVVGEGDVDDPAFSGRNGLQRNLPAGAAGAVGGVAGHRDERPLPAGAVIGGVENDPFAHFGREGAIDDHGGDEL